MVSRLFSLQGITDGTAPVDAQIPPAVIRCPSVVTLHPQSQLSRPDGGLGIADIVRVELLHG